MPFQITNFITSDYDHYMYVFWYALAQTFKDDDDAFVNNEEEEINKNFKDSVGYQLKFRYQYR